MMDWWFDDQPVWFRTDHGPILAAPYPSMEMNHIPGIINQGPSDEEFRRMLTTASTSCRWNPNPGRWCTECRCTPS
ncbi:MAG: hypothetical protein FJY47_02555 [Betaproteobacteria bacterium]|nr:hypothetical protein [Betaproteobacteria bacterium]